MKTISLAGSDWILTGYWQNFWRMGRGEAGFGFGPCVPPIPATVPGAVHADLLAAGLIDDWQVGLNAAKCEWVNNREWSLKRQVTLPDDFSSKLSLECDGLDYSGHVLIDDKIVADFEGTQVRHSIDISPHVRPGQPFDLEFIFHAAPPLDGQIGYTSRTRLFKPRFGYAWDWTPRLVNVGIWQDLRIVCRGDVAFSHCRVSPRLESDLRTGTVRVVGQVDGGSALLHGTLSDSNGQMLAASAQHIAGPFDLQFAAEDVEPWWPATLGAQPLYRLHLSLTDEQGEISDTIDCTVGFKRVRWLPNSGAPADAEPYCCEVNGKPVFLRGVNWVPLSPLYGTATPERYEVFLRLYRNMNANLFRIWGGGILETKTFYDLCDRLGLLVWQEFPLSSSGIDNWPPENPETIEHLQGIAREYVERRGHHACHLLWCGGNELQGGLDGSKEGIGRPVDASHPLMARWRDLLRELDSDKRFLCTSPTGPRFFAERQNMGQGLHHMAHGPWANLPSNERCDYWNADDALFRPETGAPGCASLESLRRYRGDESLWPPTRENMHWMVPGILWTPWADVCREFGPIADDPAELAVVVKASRYLQADSYRYAAESARRRFPRCGGIIVWMGHDCIHCTANCSVIQTDASVKPAYDLLRHAFAGRCLSFRHDRIAYAPGDRIVGEVWFCRDEDDLIEGNLTAAIRGLGGEVYGRYESGGQSSEPSAMLCNLALDVPRTREGLFVLDLVWQDRQGSLSSRYLLSQQEQHPQRPLLVLAGATLHVEKIAASGSTSQTSNAEHTLWHVSIHNTGDTAAVGVRVVGNEPDRAVLTDAGHLLLLPGERATVRADIIIAAPYHARRTTPRIDTNPAQRDTASLEVEWFND